MTSPTTTETAPNVLTASTRITGVVDRDEFALGSRAIAVLAHYARESKRLR